MKRLFILLIVAIVTLAFVACGGNADNDPNVNTNGDEAEEINGDTTEDTAGEITDEKSPLKDLYNTVLYFHKDTYYYTVESLSAEAYANHLNDLVADELISRYNVEIAAPIQDMSYGVGDVRFFDIFGFSEEIENCEECYGCYGDFTGHVDPYILYVFQAKLIDKSESMPDAALRLADELEEKLDDSLREYGYVIYPEECGKVIFFVGP